MYEKIIETSEFLKGKIQGFSPEIGIILGTGLGGLVSEISVETTINYEDIPNFPVSTVESHTGKLIFGKLSGKSVVAMQGRFHYYEGYTMQQLVFPVQVMKKLGISKLIVSNACGSLNPDVKAGDILIINDHINLLPGNPLIGKNIDELGPRFPDMSAPYSSTLIEKAVEIANCHQFSYKVGVYVAVSGPNLETSAEYKFLRIIGGDVVGMSTVPEVIAANHCGLELFAISVVTDEGWHVPLKSLSLKEVLEVAGKTEPKITQIIKELI